MVGHDNHAFSNAKPYAVILFAAWLYLLPPSHYCLICEKCTTRRKRETLRKTVTWLENLPYLYAMMTHQLAELLAGLQISDASSFSDYIPTDSHQVATAAAPPFTSTGPPHERQQHHQSTPQASGLPIPNMALHAVHQQPSANGQPTYLETQGAPVSGQQGSPDWQPVPASSGQKLQNSGQFLLSGAQAKQRSRQTTLDGGLKRAASTSFQSPESLERPSKSVRRLSRLADGQILAGSGQKLPSSVISSTGAKSDRARLADKPRSGLSPYGSVAQLLDLTQDQEARAATDVAPLHSGPVTTVSECRQRRQSLLQSDSQVVSLAADHLVDLT